MIKVVLILWATVSWGRATTSRTCASLPLQVLNFKQLVLESPFRVVFSPDPKYICSTILYTMPSSNSSDYDLASTYINNTSIMSHSQLTISGNNTYDTVKACADGATVLHLFLKVNVEQGQGFCVFTCSPDGTSMIDIKCVSRGGGFDAEAFENVLTTVSGVPGAPTTSVTIADCAKPLYCDYFD